MTLRGADTSASLHAQQKQSYAARRAGRVLTLQKTAWVLASPSRRMGNLTSQLPTMFWILNSCSQTKASREGWQVVGGKGEGQAGGGRMGASSQQGQQCTGAPAGLVIITQSAPQCRRAAGLPDQPAVAQQAPSTHHRPPPHVHVSRVVCRVVYRVSFMS